MAAPAVFAFIYIVGDTVRHSVHLKGSPHGRLDPPWGGGGSTSVPHLVYIIYILTFAVYMVYSIYGIQYIWYIDVFGIYTSEN